MNTANLSPTKSRARRALRILKILKGHSKGLSNRDLARLLNESRTNISRTLPLMIEEGVVEQCPHGYYKLGEQLLQIALAYLDEADRAQIKSTEQRLRCVSSALKQ